MLRILKICLKKKSFFFWRPELKGISLILSLISMYLRTTSSSNFWKKVKKSKRNSRLIFNLLFKAWVNSTKDKWMIKLCTMIIKFLSSDLKLNYSNKKSLVLIAKIISSKKVCRKTEISINNRYLSLIHKLRNYKIAFFNIKIKFKCIFNKLNNKIKIFAYSSKI